ncbi:MAG: hypothetical protein JW822_02240 [Spirochaetales bacterium]|nr:hypothetical protein [Spirochaetales bacterium]
MKNKILKRTITFIITTALLLAAVIISAFITLTHAVKVDSNLIQPAITLPFASRYNLLQTYNDCGPYSCAIVVHVLTQADVNIEEFVQNMEWRLPNRITLPWGLEKLLLHYGIKSETPLLILFSRKERIKYLKAQLSLGKPVIVLGLKHGMGHYITLLGYSDDEFYVYDSWHTRNPLKSGSYTYDDNGMLPGNITLSEEELLSFWQGSEKFLLFAWYVLVATVSS